MRGVGRSTGRASLTGFAEIKDVIAVCKWVSENQSADRILLVGSSAGAPIAGSAVDQVEQVVGYVSLGYLLRISRIPDCFHVSSSGQFAGLRCHCHPFPEPPFLAKVGALQFSASALVGIRSTTSGFHPMQTR